MLTYQELMSLDSFKDRFEYLCRNGKVADETFGSNRWMNQRFYRSKEWRDIRDFVISRDGGFDLGHPDFPIPGKILIHHMNPLTPDLISQHSDLMLNPDNLISCSLNTHNLIHYGDVSSIPRGPIERTPNDTAPWRR